jgi:hypothetical protein
MQHSEVFVHSRTPRNTETRGNGTSARVDTIGIVELFFPLLKENGIRKNAHILVVVSKLGYSILK